jgi:hypothetical protein
MWRSVLSLAVVAGGLLGWLTTPARADRVLLSSTKDTTIFGPFGDRISNGSGPYLFSGQTYRFGSRRALLRFDISEGVPALSRIDAVQLRLHNRTSAGTFAHELHRLRRDWGEAGSVTSSGGGAIAQPGDATWTHAVLEAVPWASPGGDFEPTASAQALVGQLGDYFWGSTAALVADVQSWLDAPATNGGWILIGDESSGGSLKRFDSRESADTDLRPMLIVDFTRQTAVESKSWGTIKSLYGSRAMPASSPEVGR